MARCYSNESFPLRVVRELRLLGHDVMTSLDAGQAQRIHDALTTAGRDLRNTLVRVNRPAQ
jgi:hypothetical protein